MQPSHYVISCAFLLLAACQGKTDQTNQGNHSSPAAVVQKDTAAATQLIIPGKQAGQLFLGQDIRAVDSLLGHADDGDAAMGSALGIWYARGAAKSKTDPTVIFSSYRDSNMVAKAVKQISVAAPVYKTAEGAGRGTRLEKLMLLYPRLKQVAVYTKPKTTDTLRVYDLSGEGIAFDIQHGECTAVTVHAKSTPVNSTYLSVHPDWKMLSPK